jgi:hypothetical protein
VLYITQTSMCLLELIPLDYDTEVQYQYEEALTGKVGSKIVHRSRSLVPVC